MKVWRGCDDPPEGEYEVLGEKPDRCPRFAWLNWSLEMSEILFAYRNYKNGMLLRAGALGEQPNRVMELMKIVDSAVAVIENDMMESTEKRLQKSQGGSDVFRTQSNVRHQTQRPTL